MVHHKLRLRGSIDYGALLIAVQRVDRGARAVIGAIGPAPFEVSATSAEDLPEVAYQQARPLRTHLMSSTWRRHMVRVSVRRTLAKCPA